MQNLSYSKLSLLALLPALLLLAACSRQEQPAADPHAGHAHAAHAGHDHDEAQAAAETADADMCGEHNVLEAQCGICQPDSTSELEVGHGLKVRLPASDSAAIAGVQLATPAVGQIADGVEAYAELAFDQNKLAKIAAPVGGTIQEVPVDLGTRVEENQVVARIWSADIAEAVAKAVLSHQTLERERKLRAQRVTPEKDLQQAEADHRAACQLLRTFGFTEEQIDTLGTKPQEQVLMEVRAPFAGEIVERNAVRGALVEPGRMLFTVADRSVMWAMLNLPESSLADVRVGQTVELRLESLPGRTFTGKLTWIGAEVNDRTRMAQARVEVPNPDGLLKAGMFAQAHVLTRQAGQALLLPQSAIQRVAGKTLVFVRLADDLFEARAVQPGASRHGQVEIRDGLAATETVAITRTFPLKSALLISRLGAGCADD
ncbi:MAG TPA: efflux RND transporter periplasmic adaptor subunit [Clostridia bacterium]|nr:efflux RND transporter periplasmic adaptor subunit [Clostridia bacterium]